MGASDRGRLSWLTAAVLCSACTLTGLGDYTIETCPHTVGATLLVHPVGTLPATPPATFASLNGATPIAAFVSVSGSCVQGVSEGAGAGATLARLQDAKCTLLTPLAPHQPMVVPSHGAMVGVASAATTPCLDGQIQLQSVAAGGVAGDKTFPPLITVATNCPPGAALPSIYPLGGKGAQDLVAWYATSYKTRDDSQKSCPGAQAAPLEVAVASAVTSQNPSLGAPKTLTNDSISVGPAAMAPLGSSQVLVASPDGNAVSVWSTSDGASFGKRVVGGLPGARAVSMATNGSQQIAVVAELGCSQSIKLAVGTLAGGFGPATTVVPKGSHPVYQPSVAWVASEQHWIVGWIQVGVYRALARRFDARGNPVGGVIDPSAKATAGIVEADGTLLDYEPDIGGGSLVKRSLGCPP